MERERTEREERESVSSKREKRKKTGDLESRIWVKKTQVHELKQPHSTALSP